MSKITKIVSFLVVTTVIGIASSAAMACVVCEAPAPEPVPERQSDGGGADSTPASPSGVSIDLNVL